MSSSERKRPVGKLTLVRVAHRVGPHNFAVYASLIYRDENGDEFFFRASSFHFDLKEISEIDTSNYTIFETNAQPTRDSEQAP